MSVVIGVDAGGTSTTAAVWRDGTPLGRATGPAGAVRPTRTVAAAARIADTVRSALTASHLLVGDLLVVGAAGTGRAAEREELRGALRTHDLADRMVITTDVELALAAAFGRSAGILLVAGTGSIALRRDAAGTLHRTGGYGPLLGDEGSGYWIGRTALQAAVRAADGRGPPTELAARLPAKLRLESLAALVRWSLTATPTEVAALAPTVAQAAAEGDAVAGAILDGAADELAALVRALLRPVGEVATVALSGGLVYSGGPLRARVADRLQAIEGIALQPTDLDPVSGALVLADE